MSWLVAPSCTRHPEPGWAASACARSCATSGMTGTPPSRAPASSASASSDSTRRSAATARASARAASSASPDTSPHASTSARSTSTSAASTASSDAAAAAPPRGSRSPQSNAAGAVIGRRPRTGGTPSRPRPAGGCRIGSRPSRRPAATSVPRRDASTLARNGSRALRSASSAKYARVKRWCSQPAGEHGHQHVGRGIRSRGAGLDRRERVVAVAVHRGAPEARDAVAVALEAAAHGDGAARGIRVPDLDDRVGHRIARAVVHRAVEPDGVGMPRRRHVGAAGVRQRVAEERADRLRRGLQERALL